MRWLRLWLAVLALFGAAQASAALAPPAPAAVSRVVERGAELRAPVARPAPPTPPPPAVRARRHQPVRFARGLPEPRAPGVARFLLHRALLR